MKGVFLDWATMGPGLDVTRLRTLLSDLTVYDVTQDDEVADRIAAAGCVLTNKIRLNDELLRNARELRYIGLTATGTDNIDLDAARRHGIAVANIRAYCSRSVAEHVFGCLLYLAHSLGRYSADVQAGAWQKSTEFCLLSHPVRELSTMTLGIVGYGELGRTVAEIAGAFGMQVIVSARPGQPAAGDRVAFDDVLEQSDVISLHCPLTPETRGLLGAREFAKMKETAILINTARGGLVDSAALADALAGGEIGGAAVDVLPQEPPVDGDPLLDYRGDNLIVTPHIAWATDRARQAAIDELGENLAAFQAGRERNRVV
jgi:glycerate dehydrogenase